MTPFLRRPTRLTLVTSIVVVLTVVNGVLAPQRAWSWILAVTLMAGIRLLVGMLSRTRRSEAARRDLRKAGAFGGLMLATALAVALSRSLGLEHDAVFDRALGVVASSMLLVLGNAIPKTSVSPTRRSCLEGSYAMRRFAGWMFAGAGAIGLSAWLFAPLAEAEITATVACFSAVALVIVRCIATPAAKAID